MELTIPTDLSDFKLHHAQRFWVIQQNEKLSDEMKWIHGVAVFSDKPLAEIATVKISNVQEVYLKIAELILPESEPTEHPLLRFFEYGGQKYGFEPDLREIETGAFVDLDEYIKDVNLNLHKIMAILYRPVTVQTKQMYQVKSYVKEQPWQREHRQKVFLTNMPYSYVRGAVNFFRKAATKHSTSSSSAANSAEKKTPTSPPGDGSTLSTPSVKGTSSTRKPSSKKRSTKP